MRRAARALVSADGATFVLREADQCFDADEDAIAPLWKGRRFPVSECVSGWSMLHRRPAVVQDIYADERIPADAYRPTFVQSLVMVPIRTSDPIGAIGTYWANRRQPTESEVAVLQALADSTSIALENVALYGELENRVRERTEALDAARGAEERLRDELEEHRRTEAQLRRTEQQLRHAQKMDAIGQLAGGVAHDFNNVLSVILGYASVISGDLKPSDPLREDVEEIRKAAVRAAALTQQLLAFSRQQVLEPRALDLKEVASGMERMLRRLIGDDVVLELRCAPGLHPVLADAGQVEQVLMNLAINSRDAMPRGEQLTVEMKNITLNGEYASGHLGVAPGEYVMLAVSDTGIGMDPETEARIFEPFFTTKPKGKGMGLGLSTVFGIVKQTGGHIWVYSELGTGTTFKVYLPKYAGAVTSPRPPPVEVRRLTGSETVLLVEDDEPVRVMTRGILRRAGYNVLDAHNAGEALLTCEQHPQRIHLLLTDVVMPQMSGVQLAQRLASVRPDMRVLCMSGYTDDAVLRHGVIDSSIAFIQKPLVPDALLLKVRQLLETDD
ncbi:MAG: response regulator [Sandaracinaceae bacterium]|nr:response regulator [Sandaracinaceae bacterium]